MMNLIFDFDGTLVDSFHRIIDKFNLIADEFHFRKISAHEVAELRDLTSKEIIKYLKIPLFKIPGVISRARKCMHEEMLTLEPFANLAPVLESLNNKKFHLGILTSNSKENVTLWLEHHKLRHLFQYIHTESSYLGKKRILKKIINRYNMEKSKSFYIGDETRDIEAAKKCDIYSIAVTWGFNSEKILLQSEPHFVAREPKDILTIFQDF